MKFESVALEQESQGQSAAVEKGHYTPISITIWILCALLNVVLSIDISRSPVAQPEVCLSGYWRGTGGSLRRKVGYLAALSHPADTENKRYHGFC